jgi:hypothetical protein
MAVGDEDRPGSVMTCYRVVAAVFFSDIPRIPGGCGAQDGPFGRLGQR